MIPAGYAASIFAWATRPDLSSAEKAARQTIILALHDDLVSAQLGTKPLRSLTAGAMNGKSFQWAVGMTTEEKLTVITDVLHRLGLLGEAAPVRVTYARFDQLAR
jgi:hypothetical protein